MRRLLSRYSNSHFTALCRPLSGTRGAADTLQEHSIVRRNVDTDIEDILNKKAPIPLNDTVSGGVLGTPNPDLQKHFDLTTQKCNDLLQQLDECLAEDVLEIVDDIAREIVSLSDTSLFLAKSLSEKSGVGLSILKQTETYIDFLNSNQTIFCALKSIVNDSDTTKKMDDEAIKAVTMYLSDFKNKGLNLSAERQEKVQSLIKQNDQIVLHDWCGDVPSDAVREQAYLSFYKHSSKQETTLHALLDQRQRLSSTTGYANYAERALQGSMAGTPGAVKDFLHELHEQLRPVVREEYYQIEKFKFQGSKFWYNRGHLKVNECVVFPWDMHYVTGEMRNLWIKQETKTPVRPDLPRLPDFLSVGSVVEQIGVWLEDTFGITLVPEQPLVGELWRADVIKLAVEHETEGLLGFLYLDFYDCDKKRAPPCNNAVRCGTDKQLPITVVECGFVPSNGYRPPHLTMNSLEKFFREIGSAVHLMLSRTKYSQTSAVNLPADVKHVSGYLFRNISRHPAFLNHVMKHHTRTNIKTRIRPGSILAMSNALNLVRGHELEDHLLYSALDQSLHTEWPYQDGRSSTEVFARHCEHFTHLPYVDGTAPHLRFPQLYTLGGQVYSHLWSQAVANILYEELFVLDPFSRHAGEYIRDNFLKDGASRNPREMVEYLTGTKLTAERLAHALARPVEMSQNYGHGYLVNAEKGGKQWWHREISSPDSPLLSRLSDSHPHLVTQEGVLKVPTPFNKEALLRQSDVNQLEDSR